jgi:predicted nucleic-acid-binding protein
MIAIDTNILVRYITQDDKLQSQAAEKLGSTAFLVDSTKHIKTS